MDIAATLSTLSLARLQAGDAQGAAAAELEALSIFREVGDRLGEAIGLLHLSHAMPDICVSIGLPSASTSLAFLHSG